MNESPRALPNAARYDAYLPHRDLVVLQRTAASWLTDNLEWLDALQGRQHGARNPRVASLRIRAQASTAVLTVQGRRFAGTLIADDVDQIVWVTQEIHSRVSGDLDSLTDKWLAQGHRDFHTRYDHLVVTIADEFPPLRRHQRVEPAASRREASN